MNKNCAEIKGVDYILNSKRPYPDWIKNHSVFKSMNKIDKVFPKIGLANFKEPCDIMNTQEAASEANKLGQQLVYELQGVNNQLYKKLEDALVSKEATRNEACSNIQSCIDLISKVMHSMNYRDYVKVVEGKVVLKLRADLFNGTKDPIFRKDEAILRIMNKISEMCEKFDVKSFKVDQLQAFKDFSRVNIPNKKYTIAFSSSGEEGAWDIGTISMRGVTSCQSWNAPQSRGLIGSISSKFVGVIYVASEQEIPGYGSKMLNRCIARFAINKKTKKPAILLDHMYPNENADTAALFKRVIKEKSGLDVLFVYNTDRGQAVDYYIPNEPARKLYQGGEAPYMDSPIQIMEHQVSIRSVPKDIISLTLDFKSRVSKDLSEMVRLKAEMFANSEAALIPLKKEYEEAKKKFDEENKDKPENERPKFELEEPKMEAELHSFARGGIINFLTHCDKKNGKNAAGKVFADLFLNSVELPADLEFNTKEEYHRKYLMTFLKNQTVVKEKAYEKYKVGTWMKSFPKSSEKFFDMIYKQMRPYFMASVKEMIKKTN